MLENHQPCRDQPQAIDKGKARDVVAGHFTRELAGNAQYAIRFEL
jgi:hypothetical protein